jgi:hypothetical protein
MIFTISKWVIYLSKARRADKKSRPATPLGKSISSTQKRVQLFLQLIWANKALNEMRYRRITAGAAWTEAVQLKNGAIFARKALASPWPQL